MGVSVAPMHMPFTRMLSFARYFAQASVKPLMAHFDAL